MDLYANKNIKITKNALTGKEISILYEKHSEKISGVNLKKASLNKKFYSTSTKSTIELNTNDKLKNDNYLSYISPLKPKKSKSLSKVINIQDKKSFSAMDIETIEFKGKEIPVSISIRTKNKLEIFIIAQNLFLIEADMAIIDVEVAIEEF